MQHHVRNLLKLYDTIKTQTTDDPDVVANARKDLAEWRPPQTAYLIGRFEIVDGKVTRLLSCDIWSDPPQDQSRCLRNELWAVLYMHQAKNFHIARQEMVRDIDHAAEHGVQHFKLFKEMLIAR